MRIGIDVRYLSHGLLGGVHTYIAQFVPELIGLAVEHKIFLYADDKRPFELAALPENVTVRCLPWRNGLSSLRHDFTLRNVMARDRLDVAHFPANYGFGPASARTVLTLHDAINVMPWLEIVRGHRKQAGTIGMMTYLHLCTRLAVQQARLIVTVSEHAREQIAQYSGFSRKRIVVVPHAPTPDLRRVVEGDTLASVKQRYGLARPFVLADAIKNPAVLVRAWRGLPAELRARYAIVFFSRRPDPPRIVLEAVAEGMAHLLVQPPRPDLIALYSLTQAFVFPSLLEGFGIPILEAMTCGAPVIASDRGSIPEVAGQAAWLMDANDEVKLGQYLRTVLTSPEQAEHLRALGLARAQQFSWPRTARRILESYQQALAA